MSNEIWLDAEREAGDELLRLRLPSPSAEKYDRTEICCEPRTIMSMAPWCVAGLSIEGVSPEANLGTGEIVIIRGCSHIVTVSISEVRAWKKWLTRVSCPPRQNMSFHVRYADREFDLRVYWKRAQILTNEIIA